MTLTRPSVRSASLFVRPILNSCKFHLELLHMILACPNSNTALNSVLKMGNVNQWKHILFVLTNQRTNNDCISEKKNLRNTPLLMNKANESLIQKIDPRVFQN